MYKWSETSRNAKKLFPWRGGKRWGSDGGDGDFASSGNQITEDGEIHFFLFFYAFPRGLSLLENALK